MGMLADWANNDLDAFKGKKNELWYVHVIVPDTSTMKPSMGNIAFYHNGSAEAKKWAADTKDAIRNGDPAELFIEKRASGKAAAPKLAKPKVGVPKRAARPIAAAPAETPVGKPVPRRRRKPIAGDAAAA